MARSSITLGRLMELPHEELKNEWARRFGAPPALSIELLRLGLGYKLQEQKLGSLSRSTRAILKHSTAGKGEAAHRTPLPRKLIPGTKLVRDWHGVGYTVTVLQYGFEYDGRTWRSLTGIVAAITGTKWNGPRFFGLSERRR